MESAVFAHLTDLTPSTCWTRGHVSFSACFHVFTRQNLVEGWTDLLLFELCNALHTQMILHVNEGSQKLDGKRKRFFACQWASLSQMKPLKTSGLFPAMRASYFSLAAACKSLQSQPIVERASITVISTLFFDKQNTAAGSPTSDLTRPFQFQTQLATCGIIPGKADKDIYGPSQGS